MFGYFWLGLNEVEILNRTLDLNLILVKAHSFIKLSLLRACIAPHKFDDVYLSEPYPNVNISNDDNSLEVLGYNLFRVDHPSDIKREGVWKFSSLKYSAYCLFTGVHQFWDNNWRKTLQISFISLAKSFALWFWIICSNNSELNIDAVTTNSTFLTAVLGDFNF